MTHHCVRQRTSNESGTAALCTIARHYDLPLEPADLPALTGLDDLQADLTTLLVFARLTGFEAIPLEGEYDQLPEVTRPNIVTLSNGQGSDHFVILFEITDQGVTIGNPATGRIENIAREAFIQQWSGDCLYIVPDESSFPAVKEKWQALNDPQQRWRRMLGLTPPYRPKLLFTLLLIALTLFQAAALTSLFGPLSTAGRLPQTAFILLGITWLAATWSWIAADNCPACSQTATLVGALPLALAGTGFYTLLLLVMALLGDSLLVSLGVFAAVGVHLYLVRLLIQARLKCLPCFLTAAALFLAATTLAIYNVTLLFPLVAALSFLAAWQVVHLSKHLATLEAEQGNYKLAQAILQEERTVPPGQIHLVVYKRPKCLYCILYETVLKPALLQDFGEQVTFEERDGANHKARFPLIMVLGAINLMLVRPEYEQLAAAVQAAISGDVTPLRESKGLFRLF